MTNDYGHEQQNAQFGVEIMYGISNPYYNKGYTTQAMQAFFRFLHREN